MTIQPPPDEEIRPPTPDEPPETDPEPEIRAPGADEPPMRLPRDTPDVETEL